VGAAIAALADSAALGVAGAGPVADDLARIGEVIDRCDRGAAPVAGLRGLVAAVDDADKRELWSAGPRLSVAVAAFAAEAR
jgi:hypothetical protein